MNLSKNDRTIKLLLTGGVSSLLIGLPYAYRLFGPQESDVGLWGSLSIYTGVILISLTIVAMNREESRIIRFILGVLAGFTALIQIPPIAAWILLHGHSSLTDTPLQGAFKVHWGISIPHFIIFLVCTIAVVRLIRTKTGTGE